MNFWRRHRRLAPFGLAELLCALCFAALILPMGAYFHLDSAGNQLALRLLFLLEYVTILFALFCILALPGKKKIGALCFLILMLPNLLCSLLDKMIYLNTISDLGLSDDVWAARRFGICFAFALLTVAALGVWVLVRCRKGRPKDRETADSKLEKG